MPPLADAALKCFAVEQVGPRAGGRSNDLFGAPFQPRRAPGKARGTSGAGVPD